jgi:tripartite-type tricarboxylate transporter receptor subunit TctC
MKPLFAAMGAVLAMLAALGPTSAQTYPSKPITLVVPFAAGGPADTLARLLAERMKEPLGQTLVVENVAGAAGSIGVARVVRAAPDGYTIGIGHLGTHVFNGALQMLPYDLVADLSPIILLPSNYSVIVTKPDVPARDLKALVAWLKANPSEASAATAGVGTVAHVASVYFQKMTGVALRIVPYRGGGPAVADVMAGHVTFLFDQLTAGSIERYRTGKLRAFAVTAPARIDSAPDLPTVDEAGLPGLYVSTWYGLWAPKGTPRAIIERLNAAAAAALDEPELRRRLAAQSAVFPSADQRSPEALAAFQKAEIAKWWPIIQEAGITVQ